MFSFLRSLFRTQKIVYFVPHQDDEFLTLGIDICQELRKGREVHVVLCSDGSKSWIRQRLNDGKSCPYHAGLHQYSLDIPAFIAARDREFIASCTALGVAPQNIHFFPKRIVDCSMSVDQGAEIMRSVLAEFSGNVSVRTLSPFGGKTQHRDHTNLGQAALNLYNQGIIRDLQLFVEPYCVESCQEANPILKLTRIPGGEFVDRLENAAAAYSLWAPEEGRYAIGYHSVTGLFRDFLNEPAAFCHVPTRNKRL